METDKKDTGSTARKVKALQKSYNKILVDLFTQYAPECIESALDEVEGSFGQNIHDVVSAALKNLENKVYEELGVEANDAIAISIGGADDAGEMSTDNKGFGFGFGDAESPIATGGDEEETKGECEKCKEEDEEKEKEESKEEEKEEDIEEKHLPDQEKLGTLYESIYKK